MYLIEPEGDRYNNVKKIAGKEIIINSTTDETDFKYTNRIGVVNGTPKREGILEVGDRVIVHHNSFRKWFNIHGKLKDSTNYIKEGVFSIGPDQIFAYDRGDGWVCLEDFCFIKPIEKEKGLTFNIKQFESNVGVVKISNPILESQGVNVGDKILFTGPAEYKFNIDGEILYKMSAFRNVKLKL